MNRLCLIIVGISVTFFFISMFSPALGYEKLCQVSQLPAGLFSTPTGDLEAWWGWEILLLGLPGILFLPNISFGWLANPVYFLCIVCLLKNRLKYAAILALITPVIGIFGTLWTVEH